VGDKSSMLRNEGDLVLFLFTNSFFILQSFGIILFNSTNYERLASLPQEKLSSSGGIQAKTVCKQDVIYQIKDILAGGVSALLTFAF